MPASVAADTKVHADTQDREAVSPTRVAFLGLNGIANVDIHGSHSFLHDTNLYALTMKRIQ